MNKETAKTLKHGDKLRGELGAFGSAHETGTIEIVHSDGVQIRCKCGQLNDKVTFEDNDGFWACCEIEQRAPGSVAIELYEQVCRERDKLQRTVQQYRRSLPSLLKSLTNWKRRALYARDEFHKAEGRAANWQETARQHAQNETYYRDLLLQIAEVLGPEKFISDDGSVQQDVLLAKVPELARAAILAPKVAEAKAKYAPFPATPMTMVGGSEEDNSARPVEGFGVGAKFYR